MMIQLTEEQLKEYNDVVEKILKILDVTASNPLVQLNIIDCVKLNVINRKIVKLPEIFKKLEISMSSLNEK